MIEAQNAKVHSTPSLRSSGSRLFHQLVVPKPNSALCQQFQPSTSLQFRCTTTKLWETFYIHSLRHKKSSPSRNGIPKPPSASLGKQDFTYETSDDGSDVDSDEDKPDVKSSMKNKLSARSQAAAKCSAPASKPIPRNSYTGNKNANMADQSGSKAEPS
ncbi:hypothetical protein DSO57_1025943 [Entomophthora muscae]|uniref:Uncharacterized protein n=1 Tax=Entomophthora muscae TaxID=34485 RepID=A0ACC2T222_9FUNG|nr:hypothetical protein DSO57_1025943 [Entomophthora muscae]